MSRAAQKSALPGYEEAAALIAHHADRLVRSRPQVEEVSLVKASGRVLARPVRADRDQPPFARSTRDGFACRAAEASGHQPLALAGTVRAGEPPSGPLPRGAAWEIMTGAPVPSGADAVVMLEHVEVSAGPGAKTVRLLPPRAIEKGENIVARGAQARKAEEVLPAGVLIGAAQVAVAASCGLTAVKVYARPRVAILATGDELVPIHALPAPGQIRNSNSQMLAALVAAAGGDPWILPIARDTARSLDTALARAATADLLLITGGVSAGKFDLVEPALARTGARFHFTGVRIQPGKPLVFGERPGRGAISGQRPRRTQYFFGLPGNPVSSAVTFLLFAAPVLAALACRNDRGPRFTLANLGAEIKARPGVRNDRSSPLGRKPGLTRFLPAACTFAGPMPEVATVPWEGSGDLTAMARANCFLVVPEDPAHLSAGATVRILLF
jgi:molybdopterin molybdotransferase